MKERERDGKRVKESEEKKTREKQEKRRKIRTKFIGTNQGKTIIFTGFQKKRGGGQTQNQNVNDINC